MALAFMIIVVFVVWVAFLTFLGVRALEALDDSWPRGLSMAAVFLLVFALPLAYVISAMENENAHRLCRSGHEEWTYTATPGAVVGAVAMPGPIVRSKRWVCDEWER